MPPSQALLLCLKQAAPQKLDEVLTLARRYEKSTSGQLA
jgi:hypothetical protein